LGAVARAQGFDPRARFAGGGAATGPSARPRHREPEPSYDFEPDFVSAPPPRGGIFDFEAPGRARRAA
ncbi:MAG: hypothetical protein ACRDNK_18515, partial [Solirubrobacteraceae bacterium]